MREPYQAVYTLIACISASLVKLRPFLRVGTDYVSLIFSYLHLDHCLPEIRIQLGSELVNSGFVGNILKKTIAKFLQISVVYTTQSDITIS